MFNNLVALGWGIVTFAIVIGVGVLVLAKFGDAIGTEGGNATTSYLKDQLGTSGLAGWAPAIVAFAVGMLFLGAFMIGKKNKRSY